MKKIYQLLIAIVTLIFLVVVLEYVKPQESVQGSPNETNWYLFISRVVYTVSAGIVVAILGNIVQDIIKKRKLEAVADDWIPSEVSNRLEITNSIVDLSFKCQNTAKDCLEEIKGSGVDFIEKLNWVTYKKSLSHRRLRSTEINKEEVELTPDFEDSLATIVNKMEDKSPRGVVVLGQPGLGKTFSIQNYVIQSKALDIQKKPVVIFSLSYWVKDRPLVEWMQEELEKSYECGKTEAFKIVQENLIAPVFDGLDQIHLDLRNRCAKRIFDYSRANSVILTSRPDEFQEVVEFFRGKSETNYEKSFTIIELQPLSELQVNALVNDEKKFANKTKVLRWIQENKEFKKLVRSPMVLYILWKIQSELTEEDIDEISGKDNLEAIKLLWRKYDGYIFSEANPENEKYDRKIIREKIYYPEQSARLWLHYIASSIKEKNSIFIEDLQPNNLSFKIDKTAYYFFSRIISSVVLAGAAGFFLSGPTNFLGAGIVAGSLVATICLITRKPENLLTSKKSVNTKKRISLKYILSILVFSIPVLLLLTLFFGFSTPRDTKDMRFYELFAVTEANVAILVTLFIGISYGVREAQYEGNDIKPVERISMNWTGAGWFGLKGGFLLGIFLIGCVRFIETVFKDSTFDLWIQSNPYGIDINIFAILIGVILGSPLISILKMLRENELTEGDSEKRRPNKKPNYGIRKSLSNLLKGSTTAGLIMTLVLGLFSGVLTREPSCFIKGIQAGIGASLLAALWFGGFDVLHHFALRLLIYINHYGPWNFVKFLEFSSRLRLTRPLGASFEFAHPTIQTYYDSGRPVEFKPINYSRWLLLLIVGVTISPIALAVWKRHYTSFYWSNSQGFSIKKVPHILKKLNTSTFLVSSSGTLEIEAKGEIYLGTFIGYVGPEGTEAGFIGLRLGNAYDLDSMRSIRHGALVIEQSNRNRQQFHQLHGREQIMAIWDEKTTSFTVSQGDTIRFIINDKEWQNNFGRFDIDINYFSTTKPPNASNF